jgi:hypothetical protein
MSPAILETVVCNWCTRALPKFRVHRLMSHQVICDYCLEWQDHAMEVLGGAVPRGCQACGTSWYDLNARSGQQVRMYVVPKDGIFQLLCIDCVRPHLPKTKELYKGTKFGSQTLKIS